MKGDKMFDNKGDNILQMFKKMFMDNNNAAMPNMQEF